MLKSFKNKFVSLFLCATFPFYGVASARAEGPPNATLPVASTPEGEADPGEVITPLRKGTKAPFTGSLLSPQAMAKIIVEMRLANERIAIEVDKAKEECDAHCEKKISDKTAGCEADRKIAQATIEQNIKDIESLNKELKILEDSQPNVYLWTGLGFLAGIGVSILTVYAVSEATK
jgi:hypothetical protein